ncbi:hypothetical protein SLA2020_367950 [Shorea laevis]
MAAERSKPLHNFSLPCLKWGNQRFLRCIKVPPTSQPSSFHLRSSSKSHESQPKPNIPNNPKPTSNKSKKLRLSVSEEREDRNSRPWNLRTRTATCTAPREERMMESGSLSPVKVKTNEKVKFAVSLLKEEVEEDFLNMVGARPPRRPKKRPRILQRQLDSVFPGLWLSEVKLDSY